MREVEESPRPEVLLRYRLRRVDYPPLQGAQPGRKRRSEVLVVLCRREGSYMLMRKRSYPREAYRLPTGGVEPHESPRAALLREAREETGLDVAVDRYLGALEYCTAANDQGQDGAPLFTSHVYLVSETGGRFGTLDPSEGIDGWLEVDAAGILSQAARLETLRSVGRGSIDWSPWGKFRALGHRFAHLALVRDPDRADAPTWRPESLLGAHDFATVEVLTAEQPPS